MNISYKKHLVGKHVIKRKHAKVNVSAVFHNETTNQHAANIQNSFTYVSCFGWFPCHHTSFLLCGTVNLKRYNLHCVFRL